MTALYREFLHNPTESHIIPQRVWDGVWVAFPSAMLRVQPKSGRKIVRRPLTVVFVKSVAKPGKYGDRHGLILQVRSTGSKYWFWRGTVGGKRVGLRHRLVSVRHAR